MSKLRYRLVTDSEELQEAFKVRRQVFVYEQGISEDLVFDRRDRDSLHVVVEHGKEVVASARVQFLADNQAKLERMAVLKAYRHKGIGRKMLLFLDSVLKDRQVHEIIIHAQLEVVPFYKPCGFQEAGTPFYEAGIKHVKMYKQL